MKLSKISKFIIGLIIILIFVVIFLYRFIHLDPDLYGPIGDSIGGTLTPFLSLITIIFIYETFLIERGKNKLEIERHESELINMRIERLHNSIDNFIHTKVTKPYGEPTFSEMIRPTKEYYKWEEINGTQAILNYYGSFMDEYKEQQVLLSPKDLELENTYLYGFSLFKAIENFLPTQMFYKEDVISNIKLLYTGKLYKLILAFTSSYNGNEKLDGIFQSTLDAIKGINLIYKTITSSTVSN